MKINLIRSQKGSTLVVVTMILMVLSVLAIKSIAVATMSSNLALESVAIRNLDSQMNGTLHHMINPVTTEQETLAKQKNLPNGSKNPNYLPYFVTSNSEKKLSGYTYGAVANSDNPSSAYFSRGLFNYLPKPENLNTEYRACVNSGSVRSFEPTTTGNPDFVKWVGDSPVFSSKQNCSLESNIGIKKSHSILVGIFHDYGLTPMQVSGGVKSNGNVFTLTSVGTILSVGSHQNSYANRVKTCTQNRVVNNIYFPESASSQNRETIYECLLKANVTAKQLSTTFIHGSN